MRIFESVGWSSAPTFPETHHRLPQQIIETSLEHLLSWHSIGTHMHAPERKLNDSNFLCPTNRVPRTVLK